MLRVLIQPCAVVQNDKGAKPPQARVFRGFRLEIGQYLSQGETRHRPIVRALLQHEPCVAHRSANDFVNKIVHWDGPLPLRQLDEAGANAAPLT
jgi:hypothetical protein